MGEIKIFRITGKITKPNFQTNFRKEIRALKKEEAVENVYKELGSKHRVKRFQIKFLKIEEIEDDENINPMTKKSTFGA